METEGVQSPAIVRATSLDADPLKGSFKNFLFKVWRYLNFPSPTNIAYDVADWLQYGPVKSITMGFRGMAKSYVTIAFCLWVLYRNPTEQVLTVSATTKAAGQNSHFAWTMMNSFDWLRHMVPTSDQKQSAMAFQVRDCGPQKAESFAAESLFGQITGRRATLIVPDDIEIPNNSDTEGKRTLLATRHGELSGAILLPGGSEKILGTAQNESSIYTTLATEKGYAMRMWPILYPTPEERPKFGSWLAPRFDRDLAGNPDLAGTSTEPTRFSEEDIAERQRVWGRTEFARQFKLHLDAGAGNAAPLKLRDLIVLDISSPGGNSPLLLPPDVRWGPTKELSIQGCDFDALAGDGLYGPSYMTPPKEWRAADRIIMYVDPSGMGKDETTATVGALLAARVFVCAQEAWLEGHSESTLKAIAALAKKWGVNYIFVESNFGQGMFAALLRPYLLEIHHPAVIEDDRKGSTQKEQRIIATLEPPMTAHRIVMNTQLLQKDFDITYPAVEDARRRFYRLTYQLTRMNKTRGALAHDDRADGKASLVGKFVEYLKQQTNDAVKADAERALQEEIDKIIALREAQGLPTFGASTKAEPLGRPRGRAASMLTH